jgi:tetratricopeptide (TPR) repeat protein
MAAMAAVLVLLGALALAGRSDLDVASETAGGIGPVGRGAWQPLTARPARVLTVIAAVLALPLIATTLSGAANVHDSQSAATANPSSALRDAADAQRVQPYAATPRLQRALLLEQQGSLREALTAAKQATGDEPTNWRTWFVLSRIEAELGHAKAAVADFRRVHDLNPRSNLFLR